MLIFGIDPGFTGAWGAITHTGQYHSCADMIHNGEYIDTEAVWADMSMSRDGQDCYVAVERVHSMPGQGVSSSFKFGMAYGAAIALAGRFRCTSALITPNKWKKGLGLSADKSQSLYMARELWPNAPLSRVKDNGRAEALLIAEYLRRDIFGIK